MSNYKVGDLADLMSTSSKKMSGSKLQSLFNEHWNKRQIPNAVKNAKTSSQVKNSDCDIESTPIKKRKKKVVSEDSSIKGTLQKEMMTDLNLEIVSRNSKKKQLKEKNSNSGKKRRSSFSEDFVVENKNQNVDKSKKIEAFVRSTKNKRPKTAEECVSTSSTETVLVKDILFSEFPDSDNTSIKKKKENQTHQISSSKPSLVDTKEQDFTEAYVEEGKIDSEKNRLESIQDLPYTLFVGNLPVSVNRKMLHKLFTSFGQIKSVRLRGAVSIKMGIPKKVAEIKSEYHESLMSHTGFVVFKDKESAKNALSLNGTLIENHHILVDFANQAGEKKLYNNELSVFLGNLPFDVDDEAVRSAFEECGKIQAIRIVRDRNTGLGKGFGYVQFQKTKAKDKALTLNDVEINNRKIRVKPVENNHGRQTGAKEKLMTIRNNMAMKRTKEFDNKKSVKKLLKKGKHIHQKKKIACLLGQKFVK